jgi:RHS repeat-associated protein
MSEEDAEDTNPYRYSGEYLDFESGYVYLRMRYYDSTVGIFISVDPAQDGWNWYGYCHGNPVMFIDPSGLKATLKQGMTHNDVIPLKKGLNALGYRRRNGKKFSESNKKFGVNVDSAVRLFQKNHGLYVDGIVGQNTWNALKGTTSSSATAKHQNIGNKHSVTVTHYAPTGKKTASGTTPLVNYTVAHCNWAFGTKVKVSLKYGKNNEYKHTYTVEDRGDSRMAAAAGKWIDIFVGSTSEATNKGRLDSRSAEILGIWETTRRIGQPW